MGFSYFCTVVVFCGALHADLFAPGRGHPSASRSVSAYHDNRGDLDGESLKLLLLRASLKKTEAEIEQIKSEVAAAKKKTEADAELAKKKAKLVAWRLRLFLLAVCTFGFSIVKLFMSCADIFILFYFIPSQAFGVFVVSVNWVWAESKILNRRRLYFSIRERNVCVILVCSRAI
jgi:hypothetical protein